MDEIVRQALAKWPHVPDCYGWLGLDARGQWFMRDDQVQAAGPFAQHKGSLLRHDKLISFIERNYEPDARGCWYFQNGPQRVFVELTDAPWVWRLSADGRVHSHTGVPVDVRETYLDEAGHLYLSTSLGLGLVHTQDMYLAAQLVESGQLQPQDVQSAHLANEHSFVLSPQAQAVRL